MKKKLLMILLSVSLVLSFASTGVFADSLSSYFSNPSNCTPSFTDDSVMLSFSTSTSGQIQLDASSSVHMVVDFVRTGSYQYEAQLFNVNGNSGMSATFTDGENVRISSNSLFVPASVLSGSFTLDVEGTNLHSYFKTAANGASFAQNASVTYTFRELTIDGVDIISSVVGEWVNFGIKPGYAFVIEGECEILERSYYINNSWSFFGTNNAHRTNGSSERISAIGNIRDGFSVDYGLTRDQLIQWSAQNPNLVGVASIYEFYDSDLVSLSSGSAFFISYPLYDGVQTTLEGLRSRENSVEFVGSVYLNYTTRPTFRYVALKSNIDANNKDVAFYNTLQPSITDSAGDVTEGPDGTTISPGDIPSGGVDSSTPPLDEDNSLLGTISKFVNDIKRLLSTAVESINTLVAEGSQFMRTVAQMFTWLPEQLTSLLIAAFTVLVVVGVLKVLWR